MKTILIALALCAALIATNDTAVAQSLAVNVFGGYTFQDKINFSSGYGVIEDGGHWGGSIEYGVNEYMSAELLYQRMDTRAVLYGPYRSEAGGLGINYIMVGAVKYTGLGGPVSPYGGLAGGIGVFDGKDFSTSNVVRFAFGLKLGVLFNVSEKIGIRVQGQMLSPVQGAGGGFYFGTGGTGASISTYSTIYQFGFTGGLQYKIR
jgi:hypothetical protein